VKPTEANFFWLLPTKKLYECTFLRGFIGGAVSLYPIWQKNGSKQLLKPLEKPCQTGLYYYLMTVTFRIWAGL
jgi:hypothetical protein